MVQDTKNFIRITRDDSNDVGIFLVEHFSPMYRLQDAMPETLGRLVKEEGDIYDSMVYVNGFLMKRNTIWTFQEGQLSCRSLKRTEVIEHHSFIIDGDDEEDIKEEDLPIFVNEDDDAGLIELEYKEPEFTSLHDAILDVLGEGPLDRLGISTRIYQKYNKSINPDRIKGAVKVLVHSGEVMEKDNGTTSPLYIHATKPFRSFRQVIEEMANQDLQFKAPETFDWTMKCAACYFAIKAQGGLTIEGVTSYIGSFFSLTDRYTSQTEVKGMLSEMEGAGLLKKHDHYGLIHWHRADRNYCHCNS